jgi:hypothetical protein
MQLSVEVLSCLVVVAPALTAFFLSKRQQRLMLNIGSVECVILDV